MRVIVLYQSKYGFTERYARWIAEALGATLQTAKQTTVSMLQQYDVIIYGGGLYAGGVNGIQLLTKAFPEIADKQLYLFTVGAADVTNPLNIASIRKSLAKSLPAELLGKLHVFHLRGGIDYPRLRFTHRILIGLMVGTIRKKPLAELTGEEKLMLETYGQVVDFTDKASIDGMIAEIKAGDSI